MFRPMKKNHSYGDHTTPVVGVKNMGLCSTPKVFEGGALILYNLKAGRDLYRATPVVTRSLGFCGLVQRNAGPILAHFTTSSKY